MAVKYTNNSIPMPSQIYPNFDFWYENLPSGNPERENKFAAEAMKKSIKVCYESRP
jgi:hypothetical protein